MRIPRAMGQLRQSFHHFQTAARSNDLQKAAAMFQGKIAARIVLVGACAGSGAFLGKTFAEERAARALRKRSIQSMSYEQINSLSMDKKDSITKGALIGAGIGVGIIVAPLVTAGVYLGGVAVYHALPEPKEKE